MNWKYLAGLFDGEGSVTLTRGPGWFIKPSVNISTNSKDLRSRIRSFLSRNRIKTTEASSRNPVGRSDRISAYTWGGCKGLVENLLEGGVIEKRPQLEILLQAVEVWESRYSLPRQELLTRMDDFRLMLHRLAKKGPQELKRWDFAQVERHETAVGRPRE